MITDEEFAATVREYLKGKENRKTSYKFSVKANQSLSSGMVAFEGYMAFDTEKEYEENKAFLFTVLKEQAELFEANGFHACTSIPNNMKTLKQMNEEKAGAAK